jgi:hypothetical protein
MKVWQTSIHWGLRSVEYSIFALGPRLYECRLGYAGAVFSEGKGRFTLQVFACSYSEKWHDFFGQEISRRLDTIPEAQNIQFKRMDGLEFTFDYTGQPKIGLKKYSFLIFNKVMQAIEAFWEPSAEDQVRVKGLKWPIPEVEVSSFLRKGNKLIPEGELLARELYSEATYPKLKPKKNKPERAKPPHVQPTPQELDREISNHRRRCGCSFFDPQQYRDLRKGFSPKEIGFEGCKMFIARPD